MVRGYWYSTETCPCCGAGVLAFAVGADEQTQFVWCDECDSFYLEPAPAEWGQAVYPPDPALPLPMRWAQREEVEARGWGGFVAGYYA